MHASKQPPSHGDTAESGGFTWQGQPVYRRCGWCKRRMRFGDETNTAFGRPEPQLWPTTDSICKDCRPRVSH